MTNSIVHFFIRVSAFIGKELIEMLHQTRLVFMLVLGPFLILLLFGIGYKNSTQSLRTLFVVGKNNPIRSQVIQYAHTLQNVTDEGVTDNRNAAMQALLQNKVDLVVVIPEDAYQKLQSGEQVTVQSYHDKIDPTEVNYIQYYGDMIAQEVNQEVLTATIQQGQKKAPQLINELQTAQTAAQAMRQALIAGNQAAAQQQQNNLNSSLDTFSTALGGTLGLFSSLQNTGGSGNGKINSPAPQNSTGSLLGQINQERQGISSSGSNGQNIQSTVAKLDKLEKDLSQMQAQIEKFQNTSPVALVDPFYVQTNNLLPGR